MSSEPDIIYFYYYANNKKYYSTESFYLKEKDLVNNFYEVKYLSNEPKSCIFYLNEKITEQYVKKYFPIGKNPFDIKK